jgi:hypothetical protein
MTALPGKSLLITPLEWSSLKVRLTGEGLFFKIDVRRPVNIREQVLVFTRRLGDDKSDLYIAHAGQNLLYSKTVAQTFQPARNHSAAWKAGHLTYRTTMNAMNEPWSFHNPRTTKRS